MSKSTKTAASPKKLSNSKDDFRALYDKKFIVPKAIRAALKLLGHRGWQKEKDFCAGAGISTSEISSFRTEFEEYIVMPREPGRHPTHVWCGSKAYATELRELIK